MKKKAIMIREKVLDSDISNFIGAVYLSEDSIIVVKDYAVTPEEARKFIEEENGEWAYIIVDILRYNVNIKRTPILMERGDFEDNYDLSYR